MRSWIPNTLVLALPLSLFVAVGCDAPPAAKPSAKVSANTPPPAPAPAPAQPAPMAQPAPAPAPVVTPPPEPEPVAAPEPEPEPELVAATEPVATQITDIRDPAILPADTPAAHKQAFSKLPIAKGDGPPVGGVGANGIHIDSLEIGRGWHKSRCDLIGDTFSVGEDERVNVCIRVIHPREQEELTVFWERDGKLNQRSKIAVSNIHAYLTRGWLPITEARKGSWKATIKSADGAVLGEVSFTIQ